MVCNDCKQTVSGNCWFIEGLKQNFIWTASKESMLREYWQLKLQPLHNLKISLSLPHQLALPAN